MAYWSFLKKYFLVHIRTAIEYKVNFIFQSVFMFLNNIFFLFFWYFIFEQIDTLRGWSFPDVLLLFSLGAMSFGFLSFFMGNWNRLTEIIEQGELDFYLALPKDELLHVLVAKSSFSGFGDIVFGFAIALFVLGPVGLFSVLILGLLGGVVWGSLMVIISSLSFVLGKAEGPSEVANSLLFALTTYPYTIFPVLAQAFFFVVFPVFFISNVPVMLINDFSWWLLVVFFIVAALFASIAWLVFRAGIRRYESGNLVTLRT